MLGVVTTDDLTWNVNNITKKAKSSLYALRQLRKAGLNHRNLLVVHCSVVRSCLESASPWSDLTAELRNLIIRIDSTTRWLWYLTNRFHFGVRVYCNRSRMTSLREKN